MNATSHDGKTAGRPQGPEDFRAIATGLGFTEGPVFMQDGTIVVTSIDRGHLYSVRDGEPPELYAVTGGGPNGATEGPGGTLYVAQSPRKRGADVTGGVQLVHPTSPPAPGAPYSIGAFVENVNLDAVSPNDLCFGPDGVLWVTDPTRGIRHDSRIWQVDIASREATLVASTDYYANGIAFGLENDAIYVVSTGTHQIFRYAIEGDHLGAREVAVQLEDGHPDGFAFDVDGNFVIAVNADDPHSRGRIEVFDREGRRLDRFEPRGGQWFTNVAISADNRLIVTHPDQGAVLEARWPTAGLQLHPFRSRGN